MPESLPAVLVNYRHGIETSGIIIGANGVGGRGRRKTRGSLRKFNGRLTGFNAGRHAREDSVEGSYPENTNILVKYRAWFSHPHERCLREAIVSLRIRRFARGDPSNPANQRFLVDLAPLSAGPLLPNGTLLCDETSVFRTRSGARGEPREIVILNLEGTLAPIARAN